MISVLAENGNDANGAKVILIKGNSGAKVDNSAGTITKVDSGKVYDITVSRDTKSGLVNTIEINNNGTTSKTEGTTSKTEGK